MTGKRRTRIDSTAEQARSIQDAAQPIVPPAGVSMDAADLVFFGNVIAQAARSEWTDHKVELAALLARTMADLAREQDALRKEGSVIEGRLNPRAKLVQQHTAAILSLRRSLGLHTRAQEGEQRDVLKRREILRDYWSEAASSDLIASPQ